MFLPTRDELESFLALIRRDLADYLPPYDPDWFEFMLSCFHVASLAPDRDDAYAVGARVFYKIVKNHHLVDGNKRSAVICTALFFLKNHRQIPINPVEMYELARRVAASNGGSEWWVAQLRELFARRAPDPILERR